MGRCACQSDDTSYFRLRLTLVSFLILVTVGFSAMTDMLKGHSERPDVVLPFHFISKCVKFGTFRLFLQSFNPVKGQCWHCHNHALPGPPPSLQRKRQPGGKSQG